MHSLSERETANNGFTPRDHIVSLHAFGSHPVTFIRSSVLRFEIKGSYVTSTRPGEKVGDPTAPWSLGVPEFLEPGSTRVLGAWEYQSSWSLGVPEFLEPGSTRVLGAWEYQSSWSLGVPEFLEPGSTRVLGRLVSRCAPADVL